MSKRLNDIFYSKIFIIIAFLVLSIIIVFFVPYCVAKISYFDVDNKEFDGVYYYFAFSLFLNAIIVLIAYSKIKDFLKKEGVKNILLIDDRWHSNEMFQARVVIHEIYLGVSNYEKKYGGVTFFL